MQVRCGGKITVLSEANANVPKRACEALRQVDRWKGCDGPLPSVVRFFRAGHRHEGFRLFLYAVCELFDDRIGENFAGDALHLSAGRLRIEAVGER